MARIADEIDMLLARAWNLSPEVIDYLINYDIKYHMGLAADDEDD